MKAVHLRAAALACALSAAPALAQGLASSATPGVVVVTPDLLHPADAWGQPVSREAPSLVRDESGRVHYLIDLRRGSEARFTQVAPPLDGFASWHKTPARHLVRELERQYGLQATGMTSWAGLGFMAFLTPEQVEQLRADPRVERITPDEATSPSGALWTNSTGTEMKTWGKRAVAENTSSTTTAKIPTKVYVLDSGIGLHGDLNVVQRVWPAGGNAADGLVGCYAHATHVAGIIGAKQNATGVVGVAPDISLVSVSVMGPEPLDTVHHCNPGNVTAAAAAQALDWTMMDITTYGKVGILNLSFNLGSGVLASTGAVGSRMATLAQPAPGYKGAFIVNSAGNDYGDACTRAYGPASTTDGIMVVGAIDDRGQPVTPLHCKPGQMCVDGFRNGTAAGSEPGSNYGACVEAWAPGLAIRSSFAAFPQSGTTTSNAYEYLSGTSMAAPFVAGLAAHLVDAVPAGTPSLIEAAVRARFHSLGSVDKTLRPLLLPTLNPPAAPAQPRAEFAVVSANNGPFHVEDVGANITLANNEPFQLSFDSVGAPSGGCNLTKASYLIPSYPASSPLDTTQRKLWTLQYPALSSSPPTFYSYRFFSDCDTGTAGLFVNP